MRMKVTIKDVAKEANVAVSTVSRVLSNSDKISDKTKKKVLDAVKKLNYIPNEMARSLATKRTNILAVIIPQWICDSFYHPFFLQVFRGISNCAKNRGYFIMYGFKEEDDDTWINRFIQSNFVEGILLFHEPPEPYDRQDDAGRSRVGRPHRPSRQFRFRLRPDEKPAPPAARRAGGHRNPRRLRLRL